jgi:hypothetical protein
VAAPADSRRPTARGGGENNQGGCRWHGASILGGGEVGNSPKNTLHGGEQSTGGNGGERRHPVVVVACSSARE